MPPQDQKPRPEDPEETPDISPSRKLTAKEAEEDYKKQLALLAEQNKEMEERLEKARRGQPSREAAH
ncbi:hypothetical protein ACLX1H_004799 [Fusarium chlamydosporum]